MVFNSGAPFNGMYSRESYGNHTQQIQTTAMSEFQLTTVHQTAVSTFRHVYLQNTDCFRGIDATVILIELGVNKYFHDRAFEGI